MPFDKINDPSNFVISFTRNPKGDFGVFAKAYTSAANRLAASLLEAPRFSDYEAYPVAFLYRHAIELSLKQIIYRGSVLAKFRHMDELDEKLHNEHDLVRLSQSASKVLSTLFPNDEALANLKRALTGICEEWSEIDPKSDAYRYPINTKGAPSTKRNQLVNLRDLSSRMSPLLEALDAVHFGFDIETDKAREVHEIPERSLP